MDFKVLLHKGAKNVEQIEDYWFRRLRALESRSSTGLARADFQYLIETDRADEGILTKLQEKPNYWQDLISQSQKARLADGDQTLWTRIYPIKEQL